MNNKIIAAVNQNKKEKDLLLRLYNFYLKIKPYSYTNIKIARLSTKLLSIYEVYFLSSEIPNRNKDTRNSAAMQNAIREFNQLKLKNKALILEHMSLENRSHTINIMQSFFTDVECVEFLLEMDQIKISLMLIKMKKNIYELYIIARKLNLPR